MTTMNERIPVCIYVLQGVLTLILLSQAASYYRLEYPEIEISGVADQRAIYELAGRTLTMGLVSIIVILSRNPSYFVVLLLVDVLRETQEMFIDPLFPPASASIPPAADAMVHVVIIALEIWALITVHKISRRQHASR